MRERLLSKTTALTELGAMFGTPVKMEVTRLILVNGSPGDFFARGKPCQKNGNRSLALSIPE